MKRIALLLISTSSALQLNAQKLPSIQQASLRAPANIKVDGKTNDWNDKFEANNTTTELLYTIANDDKKLYLLAQTNSETVMNRIANGGIKLVIQKKDGKTDEGAPFIKFPFLEKGKRLTISFVNSKTTRIGNSVRFERAPMPTNPEEAQKVLDSLANENNKNLARESKWIYTSGLAGADSLLSIYNDAGIEAAGAIDGKKTFTCEMAIDLKLLGLQAGKPEKFSYHIVVNGEPNKFSPPVPILMGGTSADGTPSTAEQIRANNEQMQSRMAARSATTDFWGEYTLAK